MGWICGAWMLMTVCVFEVFFVLDQMDILPFSPYVPSAQNLIIVSFMLWQLAYAIRLAVVAHNGTGPLKRL